MNAKDIGIIIFGTLAMVSINALAFVFDAQWINVAIAQDTLIIGALIMYYFKQNKSTN